MWTNFLLWWRRTWARLRWHQYKYDGLIGDEWRRYDRRLWRQRREKGNVALYCGHRKGRFNSSNERE
jgi:hypothetical protein